MSPKKAAIADPYLLAMQFEKIGQDFYTNLAQACDDAETRGEFARLAKDESRHYEFFLHLRDEAGDRPGPAIDPDAALDLMKAHILPSPQTVRDVALGGDLPLALALALETEQNAVLFYRRFALVCPAPERELAAIIQEEQRHVQVINALIRRVGGGV